MAGSSKRDRQLARERYLRQQARRAETRTKRRQRQQILGAVVAVIAVLGGIALIGILARNNGDDTTSDAAAPIASSSAGPSAAPEGVPVAGCTVMPAAAVDKPKYDKEPALTVAKAAYTATLSTNCGDIGLTLEGAKAPHTVNSFAFLAGKQFFDGTSCHRLTTEGIYVLQCGDPTASGSGGPGYEFANENLPAKGSTVYKAGTVAMANSGPNTNGSQFFLVYKDSQLGPDYSVFGTIDKAGLAILNKVAGAGTGSDGVKPNQPVVLQQVTVKKAAA